MSYTDFFRFLPLAVTIDGDGVGVGFGKLETEGGLGVLPFSISL
jgi:hypothetical protein